MLWFFIVLVCCLPGLAILPVLIMKIGEKSKQEKEEQEKKESENND